jgi:hypothetical protein
MTEIPDTRLLSDAQIEVLAAELLLAMPWRAAAMQNKPSTVNLSVSYAVGLLRGMSGLAIERQTAADIAVDLLDIPLESRVAFLRGRLAELKGSTPKRLPVVLRGSLYGALADSAGVRSGETVSFTAAAPVEGSPK